MGPSSGEMCIEGEVWRAYGSQTSSDGAVTLQLFSRGEVQKVDDLHEAKFYYYQFSFNSFYTILGLFLGS